MSSPSALRQRDCSLAARCVSLRSITTCSAVRVFPPSRQSRHSARRVTSYSAASRANRKSCSVVSPRRSHTASRIKSINLRASVTWRDIPRGALPSTTGLPARCPWRHLWRFPFGAPPLCPLVAGVGCGVSGVIGIVGGHELLRVSAGICETAGRCGGTMYGARGTRDASQDGGLERPGQPGERSKIVRL